jgi:hypothetical protein
MFLSRFLGLSSQPSQIASPRPTGTTVATRL